jgi:radical SAM superfamily enzyme YgiQ (UPF0313 family)
MKKILLIGINARYTHSNLAIRYLRNYVADFSYQITLEEFTINQQLLEILSKIFKLQPEIIALSVYIWNTEITRKLLPEIHKLLPDSKIILGGPEVSYNPQKWFEEFPFLNFIICGAGEAGFQYLLEKKLSIKERIIKIQNPAFNEIKFPYIDTDFPGLKDKYIYYEASRGCPFKCSYCLSSRSDQKLELRELKKVKQELDYLLGKKPRIIKFIDRTFNANREFSRNIWQYLIEINPDTKLHFEVYPSLLEEEDFKLLEKCPVNLFQFEIGIQSTNPAALKAIHRPDDWNKTKEKIQNLISMGNIHIHVDLIAGLPYDEFNDIKHSFNEIYSLQADYFQLGFLKILPGTEIAEKADEYGIECLSYAPYQVLKTKWLDFNQLEKIQQVESLLNTFYNSSNFKLTLENLTSEFNSPFEMFSSLAEYLNKTINEPGIRNWQKSAALLLEFIRTNLKEKLDFYQDCLRWDWCYLANAHQYPTFLNSKKLTQAKRMGFEFLKQRSKQNSINFKGVNFTFNDLKKAIFFQPSSIEFKNKLMRDAEICIFIKFQNYKECIKYNIK